MARGYTAHNLLMHDQENLLEIEIEVDRIAGGDCQQWLWVKANAVSALEAIGSGAPAEQVLDRAVLLRDHQGGELRWARGQRFQLLLDASRTVGPGIQRMRGQHPN